MIPDARTEEEIARLREENRRLRKTVDILVNRVEREIDQQGHEFMLFQTAVNLEEMVRTRTEELERLNNRLVEELTFRQKVEEDLREAKQSAEEADRSKTKFLAAASHDLRQPLNAARIFIDSLKEETLGTPQQHLVDRISQSLTTLSQLLDALLDISQLDAGGIRPTFEHFSILPLMSRIAADYTTLAAQRGLRFSVFMQDKVVLSDQRLLETILRNFLSNAIRYTPAGHVLFGGRRRGPFLQLEVWDTGIGIAEEKISLIFDEFARVHADPSLGKRGIGLGLSIADRIARILGHQILVRSRPGKGSVFALKIPLGDPKRARDADAAPFTQESPTGKIIAVIDNDDAALEALRRPLEKWGYIVICGIDTETVLTQLIEHDQYPDCIIADYHLWGTRKGTDAIKEIRAEFDEIIPSLIVTSDTSYALRQELTALSLPVLHKPLQTDELRRQVEALLARAPS